MAHSAQESRLATRLRALALPVLILAASPALGGEGPVGPHITASAAAQMQVLDSIDDARIAQQPKIDSRLYLGLLHQRQDARLAPLTSYRFLKPDADGRVAVDIPISGPEAIASVSQAIQARGGVVQSAHPVYLVVHARVHLEDLEAIAAVPGVRRVRAALPPKYSAINVSEGVKTHGADEARTFFGTTGTGVKVGVLVRRREVARLVGDQRRPAADRDGPQRPGRPCQRRRGQRDARDRARHGSGRLAVLRDRRHLRGAVRAEHPGPRRGGLPGHRRRRHLPRREPLRGRPGRAGRQHRHRGAASRTSPRPGTKATWTRRPPARGRATSTRTERSRDSRASGPRTTSATAANPFW